MTDRVELKRSAREHLRTAQPSAFLVALVFLLVSLVIGYFTEKVPLLEVDLAGLQEEMEEFYSNPGAVGDLEALERWYYNALERNTDRATLTEQIIDVALWAVRVLWEAGFAIYALRIMRWGRAEWGSLLDGFGMAWKLLALDLLTGLLVSLGFILLFFPGWVLSYALRQSVYVLLDHPDWSVWRCMGESRALMRGHKWELFVQDWSFLGWILLCAIPITAVYVFPYMSFTRVAYYNALLSEGSRERDWNGPEGQKPPWEY